MKQQQFILSRVTHRLLALVIVMLTVVSSAWADEITFSNAQFSGSGTQTLTATDASTGIKATLTIDGHGIWVVEPGYHIEPKCTSESEHECTSNISLSIDKGNVKSITSVTIVDYWDREHTLTATGPTWTGSVSFWAYYEDPIPEMEYPGGWDSFVTGINLGGIDPDDSWASIKVQYTDESKVSFANPSIEMNALDTTEVKVNLKNYDSMARILMYFNLPDGISYVDGSATLGAMATDALLNVSKVNKSKYAVLITPNETAGLDNAFNGTQGQILSFKVKANKALTDQIKLSNIVGIPNDASGQINLPDTTCNITVNKLPSDFAFSKGSEEHPDTIAVGATDIISYVSSSSKEIYIEFYGLDTTDCFQIDISHENKEVKLTAIKNDSFKKPRICYLVFKSPSDDVYAEGTARLYVRWMPISYDNLNDTIAAAKTYSATIDEKYNKVKATLDAAITTAETALKSTNQQDVDDATHTLYQALETAKLNIEAEECYAAVTADGYMVDDPAHNDIYTALKEALDETPIDVNKVKAAVNAAWRQYYYDQLSTDVIVYTNYLRKEVEGDEDKAYLQSALDAATIVYNDGNIDVTKEYTYYKDAYETLETAYKTVLANQYRNAATALNEQISTSKSTVEELAYDANKTDLNAYIATAGGVLESATKTRAGVKELRSARTTLAEQTETVVTTDKNQALAALSETITTATTYMNGTVAPVSDVVAEELAGYIATAQTVADNTEATAKQAKQAADDLNKNKVKAEENFAAFVAAKEAIYTEIANATALKGTFATTSVGAKAFLQDAIDVAQYFYDNAKINTTEDIVSQKNRLVEEENMASDINEKAIALNGLIASAAQAKANAVDAAIQQNIQNAIDAVKGDLDDNTVSAKKLQADYDQLNAAVSGYISNDIALQRTALEASITKANTAINNIMAYEANKTALGNEVTTAQGVDSDPSATAKQLQDAKTALNAKYTEITDADNSQALNALKTAIANATTRKGEIATLSTVVAEELASAITTAEKVRDSDNTAKVRVEAAKTLDAAVTTVNADLDAFNSAVSDLEDALRAAAEAWQGYAETHVGVRTYLAEAIHNAQDVRDAKVTTSTADIIAATNALKDAKAAADATNTAATNLETAIATANTTKVSILDATVLANVETKIAEAQAMLQDKTKTAAELDAAAKALTNYVEAQVTADIDLARTALSNAITAATTAKDDLAYDENKTDLATAITTATGVKNNASATAQELVASKATLEAAQAAIKATDDAQATSDLAAAITVATEKKTALEVLAAKLAAYPEEQSLFNTNVVNDLATAIQTAQGVQDNAATTGKQKVEQVGKLNTAVTTADTNLKLYYNTQCQKLADEYTADKNLNIVVEKEVTVLGETADFVSAFEKAEEVYVSVKMKEDTYDVSDVIIARKSLETAAASLKKAYNDWKDAAAALNAKIAEANTELAAIQVVHADTYDALNVAITTALGVYDNKKTTTTAELLAAIEALNNALKIAIAEDTEWSFTDATPEYKLGKYDAGKVTYTRSGSSIADGKYGSFCLPFEVATSNFTTVYVPAPFALYNVDTDTYKMFFKKVTDATIAPNTPFLAKLNVDGTLTLHNDVAVEIASATPATPAKTMIEVYNQSSTSSFVEYDTEKQFVWNGTLAKKDGNTANDLTFGSNGVIYKAGSYINPFRAYLQIENVPPTAKIIVDLDEEDDATGIEEIIKTAKSNGKVYSVEGKFVGNDTNGLGKGVYIINGKKVIK